MRTTRNSDLTSYEALHRADGIYNEAWAQEAALAVRSECGSWAHVAEQLDQYLSVSGTVWWRVSIGLYINKRKIDALCAYVGIEIPKYDRLCIQGVTLRRLDQARGARGRREFLNDLLEELCTLAQKSCTLQYQHTGGHDVNQLPDQCRSNPCR